MIFIYKKIKFINTVFCLKKLSLITAAAVVLHGLTGCGGEQKPTGWENYRSWKKPLAAPLENAVPGHGQGVRVIYAAESAFNPVVSTDNTGRRRVVMKEGTIIVKEVYQNRAEFKRGAVDNLTVMVKDSKNKDAVNGWVWYMQKGMMSPQVMTSRMCAGCHEAANEQHPYFDKNPEDEFRDYLFAPFVKK
jgi:hypothetical protein